MRLAVRLAVVLLVVVSGCAAGNTGRASLRVTRVDELPDGQGAVAYENLSPRQESVFRQALDTDGSVRIPTGVDRNEFVDPGYVRYDGGIYRTTVSHP